MDGTSVPVWLGCSSRKMSFVSIGEARNALGQVRANTRGGQGVAKRVYRCRECGNWHMTSQRRRGKR